MYTDFANLLGKKYFLDLIKRRWRKKNPLGTDVKIGIMWEFTLDLPD